MEVGLRNKTEKLKGCVWSVHRCQELRSIITSKTCVTKKSKNNNNKRNFPETTDMNFQLISVQGVPLHEKRHTSRHINMEFRG